MTKPCAVLHLLTMDVAVPSVSNEFASSGRGIERFGALVSWSDLKAKTSALQRGIHEQRALPPFCVAK